MVTGSSLSGAKNRMRSKILYSSSVFQNSKNDNFNQFIIKRKDGDEHVW